MTTQGPCSQCRHRRDPFLPNPLPDGPRISKGEAEADRFWLQHLEGRERWELQRVEDRRSLGNRLPYFHHWCARHSLDEKELSRLCLALGTLEWAGISAELSEAKKPYKVDWVRGEVSRVYVACDAINRENACSRFEANP